MRQKAKKKLGQNFLIDQNIQRKIISSLGLSGSDIVLEIGSGRGALTKLLCEKVFAVYAVEIDEELCASLKEEFKFTRNLKIIHSDFLKLDLLPILKEGKIKAVGNIPYYISSPIIERLLQFNKKISAIFLTVQKEFALRITAQPGSKAYGALSCFVQYYTQPKILFLISRNCFTPTPKVDSAFISLTPRLQKMLPSKEEDLFFKIVRSAFSKRRKTLRNSLKNIVPPGALKGHAHKRAEELSLQDFALIVKITKKLLTKEEL